MKKNKKGFTVAELIIVITIFSILAGVTLANFGSFRESIDLSNLAQQIAIYIKKAQITGSLGRLPSASVVSVALRNDLAWVPTYGVHFEKGSNSFCYFVDVDNKSNLSAYRKFSDISPCSGNEGIEGVDVKAGQITDLCVKLPTSTCNSQDHLDITFQRPNLSAVILGDISTNNAQNPAESAEICLKSLSGKREKAIVVHQVGQIIIKNSCTTGLQPSTPSQ